MKDRTSASPDESGHQSGRLEMITGLSLWKDGRVVPASEGAISVWDHGFLYGDGVFEGLRLRSGRLFRPSDHLSRLRRSARMLNIQVPFTEAQLTTAIAEVAAENRLRDGHVRVVVTRGIGLPGLDPRNCTLSTTLVLVYPLPPTLGTDPITLVTSHVTRKAPRSSDPGAKTLNYLDAILAKLQANAVGAHDAILLDNEGFVAEATASNLFIVSEGTIATPACTAALPGITRRTILELTLELGIPAHERRMTLGEIYAADEAFLTGSGVGIVPIREVDGRQLASAPGAITQKLIERYQESWTNPSLSVALAPFINQT
jgi:branched-chain amino acid aminotransferase